jgi:transcription elongation factor Elf1
MKIKTIKQQHRRDFIAVYECEHCGKEYTSSGYDDSYFHSHVIPKMKCKNCGLTAGDSYRALNPKYDAHQVI